MVRVPQTIDREQAAAVVTARSETGDVIIDDLPVACVFTTNQR